MHARLSVACGPHVRRIMATEFIRVPVAHVSRNRSSARSRGIERKLQGISLLTSFPQPDEIRPSHLLLVTHIYQLTRVQLALN